MSVALQPTRAAVAARLSGRTRVAVWLAPAAGGLALWWLSLRHVSLALGEYGLPPALPVGWYVALTIAVLGAVLASAGRSCPGWVGALYVLCVVVVLFATVLALSGQPHYAWVYKHIGVVRYLEAHGRVDTSIDIYNRWPGFFALAASFTTLAGYTNPAAYVGWADALFMLADTLLVIAAVRTVTGRSQTASAAGLLFALSNWVGQTYYSPQAFAYTLALGLIAITLRHLGEPVPRPPRRLRTVVEAITGPPARDDAAALPDERWPPRTAVAIVLALYALIVASHQLTPYMLLAGFALLALSGRIAPRWLPIPMAAMAAAYLLPNLSFIQHNYGLFTSIDPLNNVQGPRVGSHPVPGKVLNTDVELGFIAVMWISTLLAALFLRRRRRLAGLFVFALLAFAPLTISFGQNYGGEASLRIVLFASPWCSALIACAIFELRAVPARALLAATACAFATMFVVSYLGLEQLNIVSAAELRASETFYRRARPGSVLVLAAPGFPYRYGGNYPAFRGPEGDANPNLMTEQVFTNRLLGPVQVPAIAERIRLYARHGYIAFSRDETAYAEEFRLTPKGALSDLRAAVGASPMFRLWYANRDVQIYELLDRGVDR